jgi:hypothetical protein
MGCAGSKSSSDVVTQASSPNDVGKELVVVDNKQQHDLGASPGADSKLVESVCRSLVPAFHIDQFGNKIDDATGGRVWSEQYYQARKEAEDHAVQRGLCFEQSKVAFDEGRKKEAKDFSDDGKKHG